MIIPTKSIGNFGEVTAIEYLKHNGFIIIEKNFICKSGEIDIIGKEGDYICFIEVKSRYGSYYGTPAEAVNYSKQLKLYKTALSYIMKKRLNSSNFRFDIIEILLNKHDDNMHINHIKDAFQF